MVTFKSVILEVVTALSAILGLVTLASDILAVVTALGVIVTAPELFTVTSPLKSTAVAVLEALPTHILAEFKVVPCLLLKVVQSVEVNAPLEVAEALGIFNVVEPPNEVVVEE